MKRIDRRMAIPLTVVALMLSACGGGSGTASEKVQPAVVEPIDGSDLNRLVLTEQAAERIGIETSPVREVPVPGGEGSQKVVPYAAVIYDTNGETLMYLKAEDLVFVREVITVERIDGEFAILLDGPAPGAEVVTVGAAELFGVEFGIGK